MPVAIFFNDGIHKEVLVIYYGKDVFISKNFISKITNTYNEGFDYLKGLTLDDIMNIEFESTVEVLAKKSLPVRVLKFHEINERSLSQILMQFMLETIICGRAMGTNPFGQPAVEERKILAREMMKELKK